jgi:hypothetical protein
MFYHQLSGVGREIPVAGIPSGNYGVIPSWEIQSLLYKYYVYMKITILKVA